MQWYIGAYFKQINHFNRQKIDKVIANKYVCDSINTEIENKLKTEE